jgi:hypothetical protein
MSGGRDSNPRPSPWEGDILPAELPPLACRYQLYMLEGKNEVSYRGITSSIPASIRSGLARLLAFAIVTQAFRSPYAS